MPREQAPPSATVLAEQAHARLCQYLADSRARANLSVPAIAERLGVRPQEYSRYETPASADAMHVMPRPFGTRVADALNLAGQERQQLLTLLDDLIERRRDMRGTVPQVKGKPSRSGLPRYAVMLREYRNAAEISQIDLARMLGLGRTGWSNIENVSMGSRPTANTLDIIRRAGALMAIPDDALAEIISDARDHAAVAAAPRRPQSPYAHLRPAWCEYLIDLRIARGLNASRAAQLLGVTQQTYTGLETGTRTRNGERVVIVPKEETILKVAEAFNLTDREISRLRELAEQVSPHASRDTRPWQQRLREARQSHKMTSSEAAQHAGVTNTTYRDWEKRQQGGADHDALRRLLPHLGITGQDADEFMALVPPDFPTARAPRQPTDPVSNTPAWSRYITERRLDKGLYLAQVDELLGQQSIVRRFELGGWKRADGRLSVPPSIWLDRVARALDMTHEQQQRLHDLADRERIAVAAKGTLPLAAELLSEARRALDLKSGEVGDRLPDLPLPWREYEKGSSKGLSSLADPAVIEYIIENLPVCPNLAAVLRGAALSYTPNLTQTQMDSVNGTSVSHPKVLTSPGLSG